MKTVAGGILVPFPKLLQSRRNDIIELNDEVLTFMKFDISIIQNLFQGFNRKGSIAPLWYIVSRMFNV